MTNSSSTTVSTKKNAIDPKSAYVLVVEDNLQNLVLIARLLAFIGVHRYEWKASGWQVLEFADTPNISGGITAIRTARTVTIGV